MTGKKYDLSSISPAVVMSEAWLLGWAGLGWSGLGWAGMHENVMITVILLSPAQPSQLLTTST